MQLYRLYKSQIFIPQAFTRSKGSNVSMPSCTTSPARIGDGMATKADLLRAHKAGDITRMLLLNPARINVMHIQKNCQQSAIFTDFESILPLPRRHQPQGTGDKHQRDHSCDHVAPQNSTKGKSRGVVHAEMTRIDMCIIVHLHMEFPLYRRII